MTAVIVAGAGALGVLARYGLSSALSSVWTIVAINVLGSFLLGLVATLGDQLSSDARVALGVGFLGGFTTFSTFTVEIVQQADAGRVSVALAYLLVSVGVGLAAAVAGYAIGRALA